MPSDEIHEALGSLSLASEEDSLRLMNELKAEDSDLLYDYDPNGCTLFCSSVMLGYRRHASVLIDTANVRQKDVCGDEVLHCLINRYDDEFLAELIYNKDPDTVNEPNENGDLPIHLACGQNRVKILDFLLDKGVSLRTQGHMGLLPIHFAAESDCIEIVTLIEEKDPNCLTMPSTYGDLAIHSAAIGGAMETLKYIVDYKQQSLRPKGESGCLPVHFAALFCRLDALKFIEERDPDCLTLCDNNGEQIIHKAAIGGSVEMLTYLIKDKGFSLHIKNSFGDTPLHLAASQTKNIDSVTFLSLESLEAVTMMNNVGQTPIEVAAEVENYEIVGFLFMLVPPRLQQKTLMMISAYDSRNIMKDFLISFLLRLDFPAAAFLLSPRSLNSEETQAANFSRFEFVKSLRVEEDESGLHVCARNDLHDIAHILLLFKAFEVDERDAGGKTPIEVAVENNNKVIADMLIAFGSNFKAIKNLLHEATSVDVVEFLVDKGYNVNTLNSKRESAIMKAAGRKDFAVTKKLFELGADIEIVDELGKTALCHAAEGGDFATTLFLFDKEGGIYRKLKDGREVFEVIRQHQPRFVEMTVLLVAIKFLM